MCGIYGITDKDYGFIDQYIKTCKHRGPDGQGIWKGDNVTLGHNLLSIMAESNMSTQPWITPNKNIDFTRIKLRKVNRKSNIICPRGYTHSLFP